MQKANANTQSACKWHSRGSYRTRSACNLQFAAQQQQLQQQYTSTAASTISRHLNNSISWIVCLRSNATHDAIHITAVAPPDILYTMFITLLQSSKPGGQATYSIPSCPVLCRGGVGWAESVPSCRDSARWEFFFRFAGLYLQVWSLGLKYNRFTALLAAPLT